ncbi:MAG TPA: hypothetical protein VFQ35_23015 [Polyangiaceae bacterium]|nr:hypothetical protein [Polyangiaceae bacterium]
MYRLFGSVVIAALSVVAGCGSDDSSNSDGTGGTQHSGGATAKGGASTEAGSDNLGGLGAFGGQPGGNDGGAGNGLHEPGDPTAGSSTGATGSGSKAVLNLTVSAPASALALDACAATPAVFADVAPGTYDIELTASTLSKGNVSDEDDNESPSFDDYVIVNLPLPAGDPNEDMRFFMLHGVGDKVSVTLPEAGPVNVYFIDGDNEFNVGTATVSLTGGLAPKQVTVDATANVIAWKSSCRGTAPATVTTSKSPQRVTLMSSTFSSAAGTSDHFVLLRLSNEMQVNDHRFTMLNGIGSSYEFTPYAGNVLRAWLIGASGGGKGSAQLKVEEL